MIVAMVLFVIPIIVGLLIIKSDASKMIKALGYILIILFALFLVLLLL